MLNLTRQRRRRRVSSTSSNGRSLSRVPVSRSTSSDRRRPPATPQCLSSCCIQSLGLVTPSRHQCRHRRHHHRVQLGLRTRRRHTVVRRRRHTVVRRRRRTVVRLTYRAAVERVIATSPVHGGMTYVLLRIDNSRSALLHVKTLNKHGKTNLHDHLDRPRSSCSRRLSLVRRHVCMVQQPLVAVTDIMNIIVTVISTVIIAQNLHSRYNICTLLSALQHSDYCTVHAIHAGRPGLCKLTKL